MKKFRKNQKGFTLVELIVVLVILAILAAMLVPALLGYIDRARAGKYNEEVHSIYTAAQVVADEAYVGRTSADTSGPAAFNTDQLKKVYSLTSPTSAYAINASYGSGNIHDAFTIKSLSIRFSSQDGTDQNATLDDKGNISVWQ